MMEDIRDRVRERRDYETVPEGLGERPLARSYCDVVRDQAKDSGLELPPEIAASLAARNYDIILAKRKVDRASDTDVQNRMKIAIDDELFALKKAQAIDFRYDTIDRVLDGVIDTARRRVPDSGAVERIIHRRLPWIRRQRRELEALPPPSPLRQWVNGETHRYLGRQYRLKIARGAERWVKLSGAYFTVTLPDPKDRDAVRTLMEGWYREHARRVISERARRLIGSTTWLELAELPPITIRALSHRWGSTTKAGRITFNVDVVKLPPVLLD